MDNSTKDKPKKKGHFRLQTIIIVVLVIILAILMLVGFITDFLWFGELGYISVFLKKLLTQLEIGIPTFIVVTLLAYLYLKVLKKGYYKKVASNTPEGDGKRLNVITWALAAVFGGVATYFAVTRLWFELLQFFNSTDFGMDDPIFNNDISFYLFKLEFIRELNTILIGVLVVFVVITLIYYSVLMGGRRPRVMKEETDTDGGYAFKEEGDRFDGSRTNSGFSGVGTDKTFEENLRGIFSGFKNNINSAPRQQKPKKQIDNENIAELLNIAQKQLIIVGAILFIMVGVYFFLRQYTLLYGHTGAVYGAGFTSVNVTLWMYRALMVLSVLGAVAVIVGVPRRKLKWIATVPVIMILVGAVGYGAGILVQNFIVSPDEISKESKYLERNIEYTQAAYDLSDVEIKPFSADNDLTAADIQANSATLSNIRINDYDPVKTFYNQTQSIRQYYTFNDVDVDRYMVNGEYTQTYLSAREIDESKISETWLNRHLKYTHGYGVTMSRVDKITASGQPDMIVDNIPPESSVAEIDITRPEIYFGELTNEYVLVGTDEDEFDYPTGDSNAYTRYEGSGGIKLNLFNRVLFAIKERSLKLLVSSNIDSDSKIIVNRNIQERVQKIMPYLSYDKDQYMCTVDGKLYWIIDAYTSSDKFPYSEPYDSETSNDNYIRNSVKVVIDAYNGDTNYYICDEEDPIAQTYKKIYPKLFKDFDEMPEGIKAHIRYPNTMFDIQSKVYKRYHMDDVKVFYQNEDLWDISKEIYGIKEQYMTPNYYILSLPGENKEEFVSTIPYTPKDKRNMTGLLIARSDGENYGNLVLYQLPKSKIVYGPMQIEAQIDQSTEISKEFSLWNSSGSQYSRGNMFIIPIEDSLLYVEPVYLEATNSSIPEVKRVIVAYGDNIAYEATLGEALDALFGEGSSSGLTAVGGDSSDTTSGGGDASLSQSELIEMANTAYDNAQEALSNGDWEGYGEYMDELESILNRLQ